MRVIISILLGLAFANQAEQRADSSCPDLDLNEICKEVCVDETLTCITNCDPTNSECISTCLRAEATCVEQCPCGDDCDLGCQDCDNPICQCSDVSLNEDWNNCLDMNGQSLARCIYNCNDDATCESSCVNHFKTKTDDCPCEVNCKGGCPCDSYECDKVTTTPDLTTTAKPSQKAVLLLSTYQSRNVPMVIDFEGNVDDDIVFKYDVETEVEASCAATLNDEFWVIGGYYKKRQLSKIQDCKLTKVGELEFDYFFGGCNTFSFGILFCFSDSDTRSCHSFDGSNIKTEPSAKYEHTRVNALGVYKGQPFVTGSHSWNIKTEILDNASNQWIEGADYPFSTREESLSYYSTASTEESVYVIGGYTRDAYTGMRAQIIAEYTNDQWHDVGKLNQARHGHGSITAGALTMIIGGSSSDSSPLQTEIWEIETLENRLIAQTLPNNNYREVGLFLVDVGYCKKT